MVQCDGPTVRCDGPTFAKTGRRLSDLDLRTFGPDLRTVAPSPLRPIAPHDSQSLLEHLSAPQVMQVHDALNALILADDHD